MRKNIRRILSFILIMTVVATICPQITDDTVAEAAVSNVSLSNLGKVGTLSVGDKTKSGNWWKMYIGSSELFCLNLGATCHTGDAYQSESATYSSNSSGKTGKEACIGYWFDQVKKRGNKAYILSQALFWAVEEGDTSETALRAVIQKMKSNTGYFSDQTAAQLYKEIFEPSSTVTIQIDLWKYKGSGAKRQILLDVKSTSVVRAKPKSVSSQTVYRQRITLLKQDEDDKPLSQVSFRLQAENIDELYYFKANGWGEADTGEVDEDADNFELENMTDSKGQIAYRFNYRVQSEDYFYYEATELKNMDAAALRKAKSDLDEEGYRYGKNLTWQEAQDLADADVQKQIAEIENTYYLQELDTKNDHLILDSEVQKIVLKEANSWQQLEGQWPETATGTFENYAKAYSLNIKNRYKKVSLIVKKKDALSADGSAHGDATLDGAQFQLYEDSECKKEADVFSKDKKRITAKPYVIANGKLETDYLQSDKVYYLKEIQPPRGYIQTNEIFEIHADARQYNVEYTSGVNGIEVKNTPIMGKISVQKYSTDGTTGPVLSEEGARFQIYLRSAGSYEKADEYERDEITTNINGYACTKDLYFGTYIVHQVSSGRLDTELVEDFEVLIDQEGRQVPYALTINNKPYKAFLRIIKKDYNTSNEVLKAGTTYQIYEVDPETGKQTLVKQSYSDGNSTKVVDQFISDHTGRIMTVDALPSGVYRIYETDAVSGFHISKEYIEVEINSKSDNFVQEKDDEGNTYTTVTLEYFNEETYGKLSIHKKGQQLAGYADGKFEYEEIDLEGAVFEVYAEEDIVTQDNQGTNWFDQDSLVATITTGAGAEFTSECGGITSYSLDDRGVVTVHLPLGKYRVVEKKTLYGYVFPENNSWQVEFNWANKEEEFVLNSTGNTDENGVMLVRNDRARPVVSLVKKDGDTMSPIGGAVFALYTKDDIYNAAGEKIVEAGSQLGTVETDLEGKADFDLDLPLMSEKYPKEEAVKEEELSKEEAVKEEELSKVEAAEEGETDKEEESSNVGETAAEKLNSGDYYIQEMAVSDSYYISDAKYPVHLEYKDADTPVIALQTEMKNTQTSVEIDKLSVTGSGEIPGCHLQILDRDNHQIVSWISGDSESVKLEETQNEYGYVNVRTTMDEKGNLIVGGLLHDQEYTLIETRPADGYVTADNVIFLLKEETGETGSMTRVYVKETDGSFTKGTDNVVRMVDEQTKVQFHKKAENHTGILGGASIAVFDKNGVQVAAFTTQDGVAEELTGVMTVGETYTFKETEAPQGYKKSADISYTIQDTAETQIVTMVDLESSIVTAKKIPKGSASTETTDEKTPKAKTPGTQPKTGSDENIVVVFILVISSGILLTVTGIRSGRIRRKEKK